MTGATLKDKKRSEWVRQQTGVKDVLDEIKKKTLTWAGHVVRMQDNRWSLRVTDWIPGEAKRAKGRQKVRWVDEAKVAGITWQQRAQDVVVLRNMGAAFAPQRA